MLKNKIKQFEGKVKKENIKIINNSGYWLQYKDYIFDYQLSKAQAQEIKKQID